jgi:peptide/nickel transport system substrate-binding protein
MGLKRLRIKLRLILKKLYLETRHTHLKDLRNVILKYIKKLPNIIHLRNLVLFSGILSVVILVMFVQRFATLASFFQKATPVKGGVYREGVLGNIEKINPLFTLNSAEESANRLVFSGLTRVLPGNKIVPDLAEKWTESEDRRVFDFVINKNAKWHDGEKLTADDVVFTINLIQNPDTKTNKSAVWKNVKVEKVNENEVKFTLPNQFADFLEVASQPILPKHAFKNMKDEDIPKNIKISQFNYSPIGSGPYKFVRFDQAGNEQELILKANNDFVLGSPYLDEVRLRVYSDFDELYKGFIRKQVDGIVEIPYDRMSKIEAQSTLNFYKFYLPRVQAMFFNYRNPVLADKGIRQLIGQAINRKEIVNKATFGEALPAYAAILPGQVGYDATLRVDKYNTQKVIEEFEKAGWLKGQDGVRQKEGKVLSFNMVFVNDDEDKRAAEEIKKELSDIGVGVILTPTDAEMLQANFIRPRNFDLILIGQNTGIDPDLYSFWHSSQINDPGLNLTGFKDRKVDKFLEQIRKMTDSKVKAERYKEIQAVLVDESPAIYLYNPMFSMAISKNIKGIPEGKLNGPVDHLNSIYSWYGREKVSY